MGERRKGATGALECARADDARDGELETLREMMGAIHRAHTGFMYDAPAAVTFEGLLEDLLTFTGSEYGFIGEVLHDDGQPYLRTHAITNLAWNDETRRFYEEHAPGGLIFHNLETLFGAVLRTGARVISNDPHTDARSGGLPEGHPPLRAFLGMPLYHGTQMVGMFGVANRADGYDEQLCARIEPLVSTCAAVVSAWRLERKRRAVEENLAQSEERFRELVTHVEEVFWMIDATGTQLLYVSPAFERLWGMPCEAALADRWVWLEAVHEDDRERVKRAVALPPDPGYDEEYRIVRPDGSIRWVRDRAFAIRGEDGELRRIVGVAGDVTARREARAQLEAQADTLRDLTHNLATTEQREREHVTRVLHDEVQQFLAAARYRVDALNPDDPEATRAAIESLGTMLDQCLSATSSLVRQLEPSVLRSGHVDRVLRWLGAWFKDEHGLSVSVTCEPLEIDSPELVYTLYAAARELLFNVVKHSGVRAAAVALRTADDMLELVVSDQGRGLGADGGSSAAKRGLGLRYLQERLSWLGGELEIVESDRPGAQGARLIARLPVRSDAATRPRTG